MPITTLPTQTEGSLGQVKADTGGPYVAANDIRASLVNEWVTRFLELYAEIGKSDGTTVGSINEALLALVAKDVQNELAGAAGPTVTDDVTQGFSARSVWLWNFDGVGDWRIWVCTDASTGTAKWVRVAEPGTGVADITALVSVDGTGEDFSRIDHAHAHGAQTDETLHALAVDDVSDGFMSAEQSAILSTLAAFVSTPTVCGDVDDFEDENLPGWRLRRTGPTSQIQHVPNLAAANLLPGSGLVYLKIGVDASDKAMMLKPGVGLVLDASSPTILEWRIVPADAGVYADDECAWVVGCISTPFAEDATPDSLIALHAQWTGTRNWRFTMWSGGVEVSGANVALPALGVGELGYRIRFRATTEYAVLEYAIDEDPFTILRTLSGFSAGMAWTRATTTATVTSTGHGLTNNDTINVSASTDVAAITNGPKVVTVIDANSFSFTCLNAGGASGTLTYSNRPGLAVYSPIAWIENTGGSAGDRVLAVDYMAHSSERIALAAGALASYDNEVWGRSLRTRATASTTPSLSNEDDDMLEVDTTAGNVTIQLPDPAGRRLFRVKKTNAGVNTITLGRFNAENIENVAADYLLPNSAVLTFPSWAFYSNGTVWWKLL